MKIGTGSVGCNKRRIRMNNIDIDNRIYINDEYTMNLQLTCSLDFYIRDSSK